MEIRNSDTALVFIDPQVDVLSEHGKNWGAIGASVTENRTVENMERLFIAAKANGYEVFISPHYFFPTDDGWKLNGPLESEEFRTRTFARSGPLDLTGLSGSGADWLDRFKPYIDDGKTIVVSPHKVFGRRPTIWSCSSASADWTRSSSAACWRTCASSPISANSWNRVSRWPWSRMPRPAPGIPIGATAIRRP